jgi:hypothetical protein
MISEKIKDAVDEEPCKPLIETIKSEELTPSGSSAERSLQERL